ncbi:MAG TPA: S8 family serine peptidase [Verrucomicrobiae bacterium]|nr:S8 family serine peptidase [Verrucomicrobiae bacterium]
MKVIGIIFGALVLAIGLFAPGKSLEQIPGRLYVIFKPDRATPYRQPSGFISSGISRIDSINLANGMRSFTSMASGCAPCSSLVRNDYLVVFPDTANISAIASAYLADTNVRWASPRYYTDFSFTPNDSFFAKPSPSATFSSYQWPLDSTHLQMEKAWDITKGDTSVVIAILDSWHAWRHPDLETTAWINSGEDRNGNGRFDAVAYPTGDLDNVDNDTDGYIDNVLGYHFDYYSDETGEWIAGNPNPEPMLNSIWDTINFWGGSPPPNYFLFNHGSRTWGNVAAKANNNRGVAGSAFNCRAMPVGFDREVWPVVSPLCFTLQMKLKHGVPHVVNMSFATDATPTDSVILDSLYRLGVVLVAAAGNGLPVTDTAKYPARHPKVLSVAATDSNDYRADFSNVNSTVDLSAPGFNYMVFHGFDADSNKSVGYRYASVDSISSYTPYVMSGTSFSSPQTAGVAVLLRSLFPSWGPDQIIAKLRSSTDTIRCCRAGSNPQQESTFITSGKLGTGRLNAFKAVTFYDTIPKAQTDTTLSGTIYVSGDLLIPAGKTVTLNPGTVLKFYPGDIFNKGSAAKRGEIIVKGTLVAIGNQNDSIKFISYRATPQDTDWYAVRVDSGGSFNAVYCQFKNAYAGIDYKNSASDSVKYCLFEKNYMYGIISKNPKLKILNSSFIDQRNYAVYLDQADDTVSGCYFKNNQYGINAYKSYGKVSNNTIIAKDYTGTFGFRAEGYQAGETRILDFTNNLDSGQFFDAAVVANNRVKVQCSRIRIVRQAIFPVPDPPPSNIGILNEAEHPVTVRTTVMRVGGYTSNAAPNVQVDGGTPIDLGQTGADAGNNSIVPGTGGKAVLNNTGNMVLAQNNWWGTASPPPSYFSGSVTHSPDLGSEPTPCSPVPRITPGGETGNLPLAFSLGQNYPNPFNPTTTISFSLPLAEKVVLTIYNILGQKVRTLADGEKPAGTHRLIWDGKDGSGRVVSSGLYLYKLETVSFREVKRMIFLK